MSYLDAQLGVDLLRNSMSENLDKIYEDPNNNLKIEYPSDWKKLSNSDNITLVSPLENKSDRFQERVVLAFESTSNIKLTNMISLKIIGYKQNLDGFTLLDFKKDVLGGNSAYRLIYSYKQGNILLTNLELFTNIGTRTYSFYYLAEINKYNIYFPIIHEILNRIEIEGLTTTSQSKSSSKSAELEISIDPYFDGCQFNHREIIYY